MSSEPEGLEDHREKNIICRLQTDLKVYFRAGCGSFISPLGVLMFLSKFQMKNTLKFYSEATLTSGLVAVREEAPTTAPPNSQSSLIKLEKQTFWTTGFGETDKHHKTISNRIFFIWKGRVIQQQPSCSKSNLKFLELFLRSSSLSHFEDVKPHSFAERSALSNGHDVSNGDVSAERRSSKR